MKELVRLRARPSRNGNTFRYLLDYVNENGKRKRISLGHADRRKAERQRARKERELRMGIVAEESMMLSEFLTDSLARTGDQVRESTRRENISAMSQFIGIVGNMDYQRITFMHGELFRQTCLDQGNSPATVAKKLRHLKRLFRLAVDRKQLDENPLKGVKVPRVSKGKVRIYSIDECERILKAARECQAGSPVNWELLILVAMATGMRRAELLNAVWSDIDFEAKTIDVAPKDDTAETWRWLIKDTERRTLPLTDDIVRLLADFQSKQPECHPYIFVPPARYDHIQELRRQGRWTLCDTRLKVINNFRREFGRILKRAGVKSGRFHDFRNTALSNWFANGLSEFEVMKLAGHSDFGTTHRFYLAVADDFLDRARQVTVKTLGKNLARAWHAPPLIDGKD